MFRPTSTHPCGVSRSMRPTRPSLFQNTKISRSRCPTGFGFPRSRFTNITNKKQPADLFALSNSVSRLPPAAQPRATTVNYGQPRHSLYTVHLLANRNSPGPLIPQPGHLPSPLPVCHRRPLTPTRTNMESRQLLIGRGLPLLPESDQFPLPILTDDNDTLWCLGPSELRFASAVQSPPRSRQKEATSQPSRSFSARSQGKVTYTQGHGELNGISS